MISSSFVFWTIWYTWAIFTISMGFCNLINQPAYGWRYLKLSFFSILHSMVVFPFLIHRPFQQTAPLIVAMCVLTILTAGFTKVK
jgi:hypothetical protein